MKQRDLIRTIGREAKRQGVAWVLHREGARHAVYRLGQTMVPIPRHTEIDGRLATAILKECEAELGKGWWR